MKKTITILIVLMIMQIMIPVISIGTSSSKIDTDIKIGTTPAINSSDQIIRKLLGVLQVAGSILSIVALIVIGIRYACSSVDEQAKMKGVLIYYVIGAVLVFATSNILSIAYKVVKGLKI